MTLRYKNIVFKNLKPFFKYIDNDLIYNYEGDDGWYYDTLFADTLGMEIIYLKNVNDDIGYRREGIILIIGGLD